MQTANSQDAPVHLKRWHIAAVTLGNALAFYDFLTYSFFAIQIGHALFPPANPYWSLMFSLAVFFAGFLTRPIGAFVIGMFADRAGRRPAMLFSFVLMGSSIIAMALIPPYAMIGMAAPVLLVVTRLVQGFSLGGEIGSNTAYLLEAAAPERRGFVVSWQGASQEAALVVGSLAGVALSTYLSAAQLGAYGWRIAFLLGGIVVPFGLWLRSNLPETLNVQESQNLREALLEFGRALKTLVQRRRAAIFFGAVVGLASVANNKSVYVTAWVQNALHLSAPGGAAVRVAIRFVSIGAVLFAGWLYRRARLRAINTLTKNDTRWALAKRHWRIMVLGAVILGSATIANYVSVYIVTYAQDTLHLPARVGFIAETVNTVVGMCVVLVGGWVSDRVGRRPINISANVGLLLITLPLFLWMSSARSATALIVGMAILGVFNNFSFGAQLATITESIPMAIRVTGLGTVYSVAIGILGGTTQLIVRWLIEVTGSPMAPAWYVVGAAAIAQIAYFLIPESAPAKVGLATMIANEAPAE